MRFDYCCKVSFLSLTWLYMQLLVPPEDKVEKFTEYFPYAVFKTTAAA